MRWRGLLGRVLLLTVAMSGVAGSGRGAEATAPASVNPDTPPAVHLTIVGDAPMSLDERLASWFPEESVFTSVTRSHALDPGEILSPVRAARVGVWIVVRARGARLFFSVESAEGALPRYLTTDLELENGLDEVGMEQLAQVVYLSSVALWTGQAESARDDVERALDLGPLVEHASEAEAQSVPPPAAPEPVPDTTRALRDNAALRLHSGFSYSVRGRGAEGLAHGPGASFALLSSNRALRLGGVLRADLFVPVRPENREVELDVRGYSLRAGGLLTGALGGAWWLRVEGGAGLDLVRYSTYALDDPDLLRESGGIDVRPLLYASVGAELEVGSIRCALAGSITAQLLRTRYDVAELVGHSELIEPWSLQPGVGFDLIF